MICCSKGHLLEHIVSQRLINRFQRFSIVIKPPVPGYLYFEEIEINNFQRFSKTFPDFHRFLNISGNFQWLWMVSKKFMRWDLELVYKSCFKALRYQHFKDFHRFSKIFKDLVSYCSAILRLLTSAK